jgi:hypothetical protein
MYLFYHERFIVSTQLGVSSSSIAFGAIANNTKFFGFNTSEIASAASEHAGNWNGNAAYTPNSGGDTWFTPGGLSNGGSVSGLFAYMRRLDRDYDQYSHRTILSGY